MSKDTVFKIPLAAKVVDDLAGQDILHHSVDGEIPPPGSSFCPDKGVDADVEILMSETPGGFFAGHGDIQIPAFQTENTEAFADGDPLSQTVQNPGQFSGGDAMDLHIDVLVLDVEQSIPDITAHVVGPSALFGNSLCNSVRHMGIATEHLFHLPSCEKIVMDNGPVCQDERTAIGGPF